MSFRWIARLLSLSILLSAATFAWSEEPDAKTLLSPEGSPRPSDDADAPPPDEDRRDRRDPRRDGPGGFGRFGRTGVGPPGRRPRGMRPKMELVKKFDKDDSGRLDLSERKTARAFVAKERERRDDRRRPRFRRERRGFRDGEEGREPPLPGKKLSPGDVEWYPDKSLYAPNTLRTYFLDFENTDWEKELADFKDTDVEVTAKLTIDGKIYPEVGVRFRGETSFMAVPEGYKRSFNVSLDFAHKKQRVDGYRTLNLLNAHADPTFLRTVLFSKIARAYIPALNANFVRVVINGESWGVYVNSQQFNKDFSREWFATTKGARWKVPGNPRGGGSLAYLGDDPEEYKKLYAIRSRDEPKAWADLIHLCKVLNETPPDNLEQALEPPLDVDGALRFLAIDNVLINNDGYWTRASDYNLYQDPDGRFHLVPHDTNETFSVPGGRGFGRGPGRGPRGFGRGITARAMMSQADKDRDQSLAKDELTSLVDLWFDKIGPDKTQAISREDFIAKIGEVFAPPPSAPDGRRGLEPPDGGPPGRPPFPGPFGPIMFIREGIFSAADRDTDGTMTRAELKSTFGKWFDEWDAEKTGSLRERQLADGLREVLPRPRRGPPGERRNRRGPRGPGRDSGNASAKVELDPLIAADDPDKPLLSRLLAVPTLRERYLGHVRKIATKWLNWKGTLGPISKQYHALIAAAVEADTRKLYSFEDFRKGLTENLEGPGPRVTIGLENFADERRAHLLGTK